MRSPIRRYARRHVQARLRDNKSQIIQSLETEPEDFDGREPLWIERARLQNRLEAMM
jgi:hypothetical protein